MANKPLRIFQIAKELNISHTEILTFLKDKDVEVASHMSPVDETTYQLILSEFAKDKENVEKALQREDLENLKSDITSVSKSVLDVKEQLRALERLPIILIAPM